MDILKAKLIKQNDIDYYLIFNGKPYHSNTFTSDLLSRGVDKLSKKNCDEIFGIFDVEELFYEVEENIDFHEFCFTSFKLGFDKAMELNKDKVFTLEEVNELCWVLFRDNSSKNIRHKQDFDAVFKDYAQKTNEIEVTFNPDEKDSEGCLILKRAV